jgi:hypothetical protein
MASALDQMRAACSAQLDWQVPQVALYLAYYEGESNIIALLDTEERQVFRRFLDESQANWCELVANAVAERMQVVGFEWGESSDAAWAIWQANQMDADAELVQTDAIVTGRGYVLVQPDEDNPSGVSITAESPLEATVLYAPGNRRQRIAGYKRFADPITDKRTEVLILPDTIATWLPNQADPNLAPNPAGAVGMIEVTPQPRTMGPPRSELDPAIPIVDRIHTTIFNRLVASDFGAFRQIWATGVKLARQVVTTTNPDGTTADSTVVVKPWNVGANQLLVNEDPAGRFGVFPGDPLAGYLGAVEQDIESLASITQTPAYYFGHNRLVNLAADAIQALDAGLVAKIRRRMLHVGEAWETAMRLALGLVGDPGSANVAGEVLWADPETRSMAQLADALTKIATLGVPREVLWARWGATPQEIDSWQAMLAAGAPTVTPPPAAPAPPPPQPEPAVPADQ